jgi:hypothetical protein
MSADSWNVNSLHSEWVGVGTRSPHIWPRLGGAVRAQAELVMSHRSGLATALSPEWRRLYSLNPMVGVIDGFCWCILGGDGPLYLSGLALSALVAGLFLGSACVGFERWKRTLPI